MKDCQVGFRHIPLNNILIVDHLGRTLPIPMMFCSRREVQYSIFLRIFVGLTDSIQDVDYIIKGYCKNVAGSQLIEFGSYEILSSRDYRMVPPTEIAKVQPGDIFEISVVLRKLAILSGRCPRCKHLNKAAAGVGGWIEW